jgi:hypothetical protein
MNAGMNMEGTAGGVGIGTNNPSRRRRRGREAEKSEEK